MLACSSSSSPPPDFDANVLVGDATPIDFGPRADAHLPEDGGSPDADSGTQDGDALPPDSGIDCQAAPVLTLSASAAAARASSLDGMMVEVTGTATVGLVACTATVCGASMPCCNSCSAPILLDRVLPLEANASCYPHRLGCFGNECTLSCSPPATGVAQRFTGVLHRGPSLELYVIHEL
jgi:hypothetical protein